MSCAIILIFWTFIFGPCLVSGADFRFDFYGDKSLSSHLKYICTEPFSPKLVLVVQEPDSHYLQFLRQIQCPFILWKNLSTPDLMNYLKNNFKMTNILLLFDVKNFDRKNFRDHILMMDQIYLNCLNCESFISLFNLSAKLLLEWSSETIEIAPNLRSTMVPIAGNGEATSPLVLFRPVVDGCLMVDGIFQPKSSTDFKRLRQSYQDCTLNGTTINVAINNVMPFCQLKRFNNGEVSLYDSVEWHLLNLFETKFNFKAKLVDAKNHWGTLVNGVWNGAVGLILNQTVDFAICAISDTMERRTVVDFSYFVWFDRSTFVTLKNPVLSGPGWDHIQPSVKMVWICNLAAFLVVTLFLGFIAKPTQKNRSFGSLAFDLYAAFLRQQLNKFLYRRQTRFIFILWSLSSLILSTGYIAYFYSLVTVPRFRTIDTAQDVLDAIEYGTYHVIVLNSTSYHNMFLHAEPDNQIMYAIGQYFNRTQEPMASNEKEMLERLKRFDTIAILPKFATEVVWGTRDPAISPIHATDYTIASDYTSVMLKKRSPLIKPFNSLIIQCHEYGLFTHWIQSVLLKIHNSSSSNEEQMLEPIYDKNRLALFDGMEDFIPIFLAYLFLMFSGALILAGELFHFFFKQWSRI